MDLTGFDPGSPFEERVAWALRAGFVIGCVYIRFSSKRQHSTRDQARVNVVFAAANAMYDAPESICLDEAEKCRRVRRDGLQRLKFILKQMLATVLLVYARSLVGSSRLTASRELWWPDRWKPSRSTGT